MLDGIMLIIVMGFAMLGVWSLWDMLLERWLRPRSKTPIAIVVNGMEGPAWQQAEAASRAWPQAAVLVVQSQQVPPVRRQPGVQPVRTEQLEQALQALLHLQTGKGGI